MDKIKFDNQVGQLETVDRKVLNAVYDTLTYYRPGYKFTQAFKEGRWDGKICLLNRGNWTFPAGLVHWVKDIVEKKGVDIELVDLRDQSRRMPPVSNEKIAQILEGKELRDYQVDAIQSIFRSTRGIIQSPTGSGKTVIAAGAIKVGLEVGGLRTLFLTHQKELLHQTQQSFISSGIDAGIVGDGERVFRPVTVATVQTLYAGFEKRNHLRAITKHANPEIMALLASADMIILDEAHRGDAETFQLVINACKNAYYRIGLTATPLMKGVESDIKLMCVTGEVIFRITIQDLVDRGLLAQPYIKFVRVVQPQIKLNPAGRPFTYQQAYKIGVTDNAFRNDLVVDEAVALSAAGETVLILVSQIGHGKRILQLLRTRYSGLSVSFIHGSKTGDERERALDDLAKGKLNILISSTITDEGVDIKNISAVVLAGGMKSTIKLYQRIGRAMRPKKGLNRALIVDFIDLTNKHLAKHSLQRFTAIKEEPGFVMVSNFDTLLRPAPATIEGEKVA